ERGQRLAERGHEEAGDQAGARQDLPRGEDRRVEQRLAQAQVPLRPAHRRSALLMCCQMRSFKIPNRSLVVIAKLRGRGRSTATSSTTRPGRALSTITRSARYTA